MRILQNIRSYKGGLVADNKAFTKYVQAHERAWGMETYKGRPTLDQFLGAQVVVFWYPTDDDGSSVRYLATLHRDLKDIHEYVTHLVWHTRQRMPHARLAAIFKNQQQVKIKAVKVIFDVPG